MATGPRRSQRIASQTKLVKGEEACVAKKPPVTKKTKAAPKKKEIEEIEEKVKEEAEEDSNGNLKEEDVNRKPAKKPSKPAKATKSAKMSEYVQEGDPVPDVTLLDEEGNEVNIKEIASSKTVVLFAYPKASTPGCTRQVCGFRDSFPKFEAKDVAIFGLSADSVKAQKNFHDKQNLQYPLLSDPEYKLIEPLGAKKTATGGVTRSHWIIKNGKFSTVAVGITPEQSFTTALEYVNVE